MRAQLKNLTSPDVDLESYLPDEPDSFCFLLDAVIGPEGEAGGDIFTFEVCTPTWLYNECKRVGLIFGKNRLIITEYDYIKLNNFLNSLCERCCGDSWSLISKKLAEFGAWEFEGYEEYSPD